MYVNGDGVDIDYEEALKWFLRGFETNPKDEDISHSIDYLYRTIKGRNEILFEN